MKLVHLLFLVLTVAAPATAEDVFRESFDGEAERAPLARTWGDVPSKVHANAVQPGIGVNGSAAARLRLDFPAEVKHNLSYWTDALPERVPLVPALETVSFRVKTNVPVSLKIGLWPHGFIYHGPVCQPATDWQTVRLENAYEKLKKWCEGGKKTAEGAWLHQIIIAIGATKNAQADVVVDDIVLAGPEGAAKTVADAAFRRRTRKVRIAPISLTWDQGHRTLPKVLRALDEAGLAGADLACLPEVCVDQPPEPLPGPTANAIAAKAAEHKMWVVGNLREKDAEQHYVTSFLCNRDGEIVGTYRKSHRLPYEKGPGPWTGFALGNELPVFDTDLGPIGLTIGTDHYFPEIDAVLRRRGAKLIVWSTSPFPLRDEHTVTFALRGRAVQHRLHYAVARYAGKAGYGGYYNRFSWTATWPLGRAQVFDADGHTIADSGHGGGVAVATIPASRLHGSVRNGGYPTEGKYARLTAQALPKPFPKTAETQRTVRVAAIECEGNFERLIEKLDHCGRQKCDLACLWEYVWYRSDAEVEQHTARNRDRLARIADAAKRNDMYVVIAGELERGFNEAILFGRDGREVGRYTKINQTTSKDSKYYTAGKQVGIFDLDFGRIAVKICADVYAHEIDRVAALHQVDIMLHPTQDAGPFTEHTRLRDGHRCVDNGYFYVRAAGATRQSDHRTYIMDPWGVVLAASQYRTNNPPVIAILQLDNRPQYYEWTKAVRAKGPYPDPTKRGIPSETIREMYHRRNLPEARGDLRSVLLQCRRPELYTAHAPAGK
jgi:predicted amidohydrolase